jgi:EAL domain-containing protein (putative c-di-GMP-specific phosphodiesterase class I)
MMTNANNKAIVTAVITMAHGLQLKVVAEGVETAEQYLFLRDQKCDEAQGFLFSPPITADMMIDLLPRPDFWQSQLRRSYSTKTEVL